MSKKWIKRLRIAKRRPSRFTGRRPVTAKRTRLLMASSRQPAATGNRVAFKQRQAAACQKNAACCRDSVLPYPRQRRQREPCKKKNKAAQRKPTIGSDQYLLWNR